MALARWQATIVDEAGNVIPSCSIEVRREIAGAPLIQLYSDRAGASAIGNPFTAEADGFAAFHVAGGAYRIRAYKVIGGSLFERIWRYVPIGTNAETDFGTLFLPMGEWDDEVTYDVKNIVSWASGGSDVYAFASNIDDNLNHEPQFDTGVPQSDAYWTVLGLIEAPGAPGDPGSSDVVGTSASSVAIGTGTKSFTIVEDDRGWAVGARLRISSDANPTVNFMVGVVTAYAANTLEVSVDLIGGSGTLSDWTINLAGEQGYTPGYRFDFSTTTTDSDPGNGVIRANHGTFASITKLFIDDLDKAGANIEAFIQSLGESTTTNNKGTIRLQNAVDPDDYMEFVVTGAPTDDTGYWDVPVDPVAGAVPANATVLTVTFSRSGDKGADGAGSVDSVNGQTGDVVLDADDIDDAATTNKFATAAQLAKVDQITVTQAVDLDAIETRVNALDAAVVLKGTWDASSGSFPGSGTAQAGDSYIVSVGGTVDGVAFVAGDRVIAIADNASTSTFAANWFKADYTDQVSSVASLTGAISASDLRTAINVEDGADATDAANVAAAGAAMLGTADQVITGGARVTTLDLGNLSGNTITPDPGDRPIQKITNNGAGTIAPGSNQGCYLLVVKNTTGAGAITTSGWQDVSGEAFDTTTTSEFLCHCTVVGDFTAMVINKVA